MTEIRARVDAVVEDPETAGKLKPWYRLLCKRPCFHDEYLQTYNRPDTHLVDTDGKGVERITSDGVVAAAKEYAVDCVIYATGFEVGTDYSQRAGFAVVGRDGTKLSDYWADGLRTLHGIHVHRFPNLFLAQSAQTGNLVSNYPHNLVESARTIAATVGHVLDNGFREVEVAEVAEEAWVDLVLSGPEALVESQDCTPGYFNNEGRLRGSRDRLIAGYPGGASAFSRYMDQWHASGDFAGLEFRR
jgi:cyclohexanone monooxygenase